MLPSFILKTGNLTSVARTIFGLIVPWGSTSFLGRALGISRHCLHVHECAGYGLHRGALPHHGAGIRNLLRREEDSQPVHGAAAGGGVRLHDACAPGDPHAAAVLTSRAEEHCCHPASTSRTFALLCRDARVPDCFVSTDNKASLSRTHLNTAFGVINNKSLCFAVWFARVVLLHWFSSLMLVVFEFLVLHSSCCPPPPN